MRSSMKKRANKSTPSEIDRVVAMAEKMTPEELDKVTSSRFEKDFIIDPKEPQITFYDRRKPPLKLTIDEYAGIFWESYFLMIAFDIAYFDLQSEVLDILIEAVDTVDDFLKKHDLKLVRGEGSLSLLDWAVLIKSGKIS